MMNNSTLFSIVEGLMECRSGETGSGTFATALATIVVLAILSWWPKRAIRSCFDQSVTPLEKLLCHNQKGGNNSATAKNDGETQELPSLLEALREIPCLWETIEPSRDRQKIKLDLILQQQHEFPHVMRHYVKHHAEIASREIPDIQERLDAIEEAIYDGYNIFVFGIARHSRLEKLYTYYNGVKQDEMELILRCYPQLMKDRFDTSRQKNLDGAHPIFTLTYSEKAVSFVPLLAKIGAEIGGFKPEERGGLVCGNKHNVLKELFCNTVVRYDFGQEPSQLLDERSLEALVKLRNMGFVTPKDESDMVVWHLLWQETSERSFEFLASRLRLVIDEWNPTLLKNCDQHGSSSLLSLFLVNPYGASTSQLFRLILELGMKHYPEEFGFVFYGSTWHFACDRYGRDVACQIVEDEVFAMIEGSEKALHDFVMEAASNIELSLDAVYTLIRREPSAVIPKSIKNLE